MLSTVAPRLFVGISKFTNAIGASGSLLVKHSTGRSDTAEGATRDYGHDCGLSSTARWRSGELREHGGGVCQARPVLGPKALEDP